MEERVARADLDKLRKRIAREGKVRLVSVIPDGDEHYTVRTEPIAPRRETRAHLNGQA